MRNLKECVCSCDLCKSMCANHPCWPTPQEALNIINAGHGRRMMLDWWSGEEDIEVVAPACIGYEAKKAPNLAFKSCSFFVDETCILHNDGLKPLEGRVAIHDATSNIREYIHPMWNTEEGMSIVKTWKEKYYVKV